MEDTPQDWWSGIRGNVDETWEVFMLMMDRFYREAFPAALEHMESILSETGSTDKEREERNAKKAEIRKGMLKVYMKGAGMSFHVDGHRKSIWKDNCPRHLRHYKQQGRRKSLLAEIERCKCYDN